ncbi:MAG: FecR domain-containing protein [Cellvibrionaceae bacterium]|nr:FecR domain-containing protein [Cellvibrionaceae bacterium]
MSNVIEFPDRGKIEEEASLWIVKFEADRPPSAADIRELHAWLAQSPAHREVLEQMANNWAAMDLLSALVLPQQQPSVVRSTFERAAVWLLAPFALMLQVLLALFTPLRRPQLALPLYTLLVTGLLFHYYGEALFKPAPQQQIYSTAIGEQASRTLADGSIIYLNTNTQLQVNYSPQGRFITLNQGEAHFDVEHDPARPFEVTAGSKIVKAVGTAFAVQWSNSDLKVTVSEGIVDLREKEPPASAAAPSRNSAVNTGPAEPTANAPLLRLQAGQSVEIPAQHTADAGPSEVPAPINYDAKEIEQRLSWVQGKLIFRGEALEQVVEEITRYAPLTIEIADPALKQIPVGGQFRVGKTEALFDALEAGFDVEVSYLSEHHVQIKPRGK